METRHEACSAEGHPCNILDRNPNRFAARCPALSRQCHCVIHSCYAFLTLFRRTTRAAAQKSAPRAGDRGFRIPSGLTMRQCRRRICIDPKQRRGTCGHLHDFKTTAPIAALR
jgi:hypothetical protein